MARLQVGVSPTQGSTGLPVFLDWTKQAVIDASASIELRLSADNSTVADAAINTGGYVDSNWNLISSTGLNRLSRYLVNIAGTLAGPTPSFVGRAMTVEWENGGAVTGITGLNLSSIVPDLSNLKGTFVLGNNPNVFRLTLNSANGDGSAPINWRVYETAKLAYLNAGNLIDPDWINFYSKYAVLRLMDCMGTNESQAVDYADISTTADQIYYGVGDKANNRKTGWPVAALIEIANRIDGAIWINIPHKFTDAAITSLLTALRDGISFSGSTVKLHIEYSNEVWNSSFGQCAYSQAQATAGGGTDDFGNDITWTSGSTTTKGRQWYGLRAAQVMEIARTVFGTDSGNKWVGKLATQIVSTTVTTSALEGVARHISADAGAASTVNKLFSNISGAPYIGPVPSSDSTEPGLTLNGWLAQGQSYFNQQLYNMLKLGAGSDGTYRTSDYFRAAWLAQKTIADSNGLVVDAYEMGMNCVVTTAIQNSSPLVQAFSDWARSTQAAQMVYDNLVAFEADTGGMPSQFGALGKISKYGSWGAETTPTDFTSERGNACIAYNAGVAYQPNRRNMRIVPA